MGPLHPADFNKEPQQQNRPFSLSNRPLLVLNAFLSLAFLWAIINLAYVYLVKHGAKAYRVESAFFIFSFFALLSLLAGKASGDGANTWDLNNTGKIMAAVLALSCWLLIYLPFLNFPFLSDDYVFLLSLQEGHQIIQSGEYFRPVFNLAFFTLMKMFGPAALPFHAFGFSLHLGSSLLVFLLSKRIFQSFPAAFLTSLAFCFSPWQVEAVLWISGLQELLWVFALLLAALFYTRTRQLGKQEILLASLFTIIALLSKETAACFILLFLFLDFALFRFRRGRLMVPTYAVFSLILILFGLARTVMVGIPSDFFASPDRLFLKNFLSQPFKIFLVPWNQSYFGGLPVAKFFLLAAAASVLWISLLSLKVSPNFLLGVGLIFIGVLPVYRMFYVAPDLQGSRYLYFAGFGWSVVLASIFHKYIKTKIVFILLMVFFQLGYGWILSGNLLVWKKAGQILNSLPESVSKEDVPDNFHGAYILRNGYREYVLLRSRSERPEDD